MSLTKKFLKSKPVCKVTFKVPKEVADGASSIHLVGEFNAWDLKANPMRPLRDGSFSLTIDLEKDKEYAFRYLVEGRQWENDPEADGQAATPYADAENSIVSTHS